MSRNFHERFVQSLITFRDKYLKTSDGLLFQFTKDNATGKYGYKDSNGNFVPFKTAHTLTRSITAGTSTSTTDMGEDHEYRYVSVAPTPSQSKTITASRSNQTVVPDSGKLLSSVVVNKFPNASGTYSVTSNGSKDMGASNNYRYVNVNVPIALTTRRLTTANAWITTQNIGYSSTVDTGSLRQHGFCANLRVGDQWADWTVSGTLYIQGSTNNSTWTNLTSTTFSTWASVVQKELSATGNYRYFRVAVASTHWRENHNVALDELVIAFS